MNKSKRVLFSVLTLTILVILGGVITTANTQLAKADTSQCELFISVNDKWILKVNSFNFSNSETATQAELAQMASHLVTAGICKF